MTAFLRILLLATALLSGGVLQVAAAMGVDACCAGEAEEAQENDASCPDCPPGLACACCPTRGAVRSARLELVPEGRPGVLVALATAEPSLGASVTDIFHPPRA